MKYIQFLLPFCVSVIIFNTVLSQSPNTTTPEENHMQWWRDARFGMFIHWGLYAVPAGAWNGRTDYGEWILNNAQIPLEIYDQFQNQFNPIQFDADAIVKLAADAGMKYIVVTSKHHEGFCMFDTKQTGFNIMNTPFKRDPLKELSAACKKYNIKFCIYYSIMDWHHPDYLPRRNWEQSRSTEGADFSRYLTYMKAALKELLTNYGDIGVLWFDGQWEGTWNEAYAKEIYDYARSIQPNVIINNRVTSAPTDTEGFTKPGSFGADYNTPEQGIPVNKRPGQDWESCMTMNDNWGYNKNDKNFKSAKQLIHNLAEIASKGGNYLLNVGPTSMGTIPQESISRLDSIGQWMKVNGESIYQTNYSPIKSTDWGFCTRKETKDGTVLYLHIINWPKNGVLPISGVHNKVISAGLLADPLKKMLKIIPSDDTLLIKLPAAAPDAINSVLKLQLSGLIDFSEPPVISSGFASFTDSLSFTITASNAKDEIRYTLDKSKTTTGSMLYNNPVTLTESAVITARCFRNGKPVSAIQMQEFKKEMPLPSIKVETDQLQRGIRFQYYEGDWKSLPDCSSLTSSKGGFKDNFNITSHSRDDHFVFTYDGYVLVKETTVYRLFTESDDDSQLWIDGQLVVNNEGSHGAQERSGTIALQNGFHKIQVIYMERDGGESLKVFIESNLMKKHEIDTTELFHY